MFIHHIYVDILTPLTKAIIIMFERVTTHYQTLNTFIGYNVIRYHDLTRFHIRYQSLSGTFSLRFAWSEAIYNALPSNF